jgi:threonyl-tRNA synthetase
MKDALGREWQTSTVQCDFNLPERFDLSFTDRDGAKKRPIMVHRAIYGSLERFAGVLIEHYGGKFPFWLAPTQVALIPIREAHAEYCRELAAPARLRWPARRVHGRRRAHEQEDQGGRARQGAVPPDRRRPRGAERKVTVRQRDREQQEAVSFEAFRERVLDLYKRRALELG